MISGLVLTPRGGLSVSTIQWQFSVLVEDKVVVVDEVALALVLGNEMQKQDEDNEVKQLLLCCKMEKFELVNEFCSWVLWCFMERFGEMLMAEKERVSMAFSFVCLIFHFMYS